MMQILIIDSLPIHQWAAIITKYVNDGVAIIRYDINQLRLAYNMMPTYSLRSSLDCKGMQAALKLKYNFKQLPDNMLPASNFEAILGAMFAYDIKNGCNIEKVASFNETDIIYKVI